MPKRHQIPRIAYFVSPHGFGHAARACSVMDAVHRLNRSVAFDVYSTVPRWFFADSLSGPWTYHALLTDIGFVQKSPLEIDLSATLSRLDRFYPTDAATVADLANRISRRGCMLVVCDIAPVGIQAARAAGIPSMLVENFTWDWLYEAYEDVCPGLTRHIRYLRELFGGADFHVQTEPVCRRADADLVSPPLSRRTRMAGAEVRERLGIPGRERLVLLTMGGVPGGLPSLKVLQAQKGIRFLVPGGARAPRREANLTFLPHRSEYFHPDLVKASDAVVGKIGYSTLAETYNAGVPFGYLIRKDFRESEVLVSFAKAHVQGMPVTEEDFNGGAWVSLLPGLLSLPRVTRRGPEASGRVAEFLLNRLAARV